MRPSSSVGSRWCAPLRAVMATGAVFAPALALAAPFSTQNPAPAGLGGLIARMGPADWAGIVAGTAIIFGILGGKLAKDIKGWLA